jgi:putative ABC transport system permease protein
VLSIAGGALGLLLASWGIHGLQILLRPDTGEWHARLLHWDQLGLDLPVLLFTLAVAVLTGILFGLAPALAASRGLVNDTLKENSRGSTGGGGRLRRILVASEIAIAIVLLIGAGLLMRSFLRLRAVDPGFDARNVVTMTVSVAGRTDYVGASREILYQSVLDRVAAVPGVHQASMTNHVPLAGDEWGFRYWVEARPLPAFGKETGAVYRSCRSNYFATMRVPILAGRDFTARDTASAPAVVIINETLARREFAKESPIGKRMTFSDPRKNPQWMTIVGVVHDVSQDWAEPTEPEIYVPYQQDPRLTTTLKPFAAYMTLVARTDLDAARMLDPIKNAVWSVDRNLPLSHVQTLQHAIGNATWESRFSLLLIGIFSTLALALAMIGIYGVMAYEVALRTHEIGIRMALGAARGRILGMIARQSLPVALAGIAVGLAAAAGLVRLMRAMLYQVDVLDPATFAAVGLIVFIVAALAALIPARSAMKVDPMIALHRE